MEDLEALGHDADNGLGNENLPTVITATTVVPAFIADAGERAGYAFVDFFTAQIRNPNTRAAYATAVRSFFAWCDVQRLTMRTLRTHHVATYIELLGKRYSAPSVKQHLAAIRMLFDWLVVRQVVEVNPAAAVRGPKHIVKKGKTPVLDADEARQLLDSIDVSTPVGLRDRALIALLIYTFARVSAAIRHERRATTTSQGAVVGAPSRERRQAPRNAGASPARRLRRRVSRQRPASPRTRALPYSGPRPAKPARSPTGRMTRTDALRMIWRRAANCRHRNRARVPLLPGNRDHGLSQEWRAARTRPADGRA